MKSYMNAIGNVIYWDDSEVIEMTTSKMTGDCSIYTLTESDINGFIQHNGVLSTYGHHFFFDGWMCKSNDQHMSYTIQSMDKTESGVALHRFTITNKTKMVDGDLLREVTRRCNEEPLRSEPTFEILHGKYQSNWGSKYDLTRTGVGA